ncbi:MAG: peptidase S8/S53 domain-containing protein [Monoraphidium minutum]|nr:MAG: peptidase S8/S53 domain-containing protein [Monoraphidium minutum]
MGRIQALRAARSADRAAPQVPIYDAATNITVAILDTGIARHPDLNVAGGRGFIAGAAPASWSDAFAHGTHVAGIVGGANDGAGVYGVLPGVRLFAGKVLSDSGKGDSLTVAAGIQWVADFGVDQEGIVVINLSLAGAGADPLVCAAAAAAAARGAVVLAAAGNNGRDLRGVMPANCPGVIAVTALDSRDAGPRGHPKPAYFSNWLPANAPDADRARTVAAPGTAIQSTTLGAAFTVASGTSAACPHAAGVAARCFAAGDCKLSDGAKNTVKVAGSAFEKLKADASFRWSRKDCTAVVVGERRYFGPLIWADYW